MRVIPDSCRMRADVRLWVAVRIAPSQCWDVLHSRETRMLMLGRDGRSSRWFHSRLSASAGRHAAMICVHAFFGPICGADGVLAMACMQAAAARGDRGEKCVKVLLVCQRLVRATHGERHTC